MGKVYKNLLFLLLLSTKLFSLDFGIEALFGKYTPTDEMDSSKVNYAGIRNNFYIAPDFALNLKYDMTQSIKGKNLHRYGIGMRYQVINLDENFQPFFDLSAGINRGLTTDSFFQFALGGKYYLTSEFNILGEANYIKTKDSSLSYSFGLGIGYDFFRTYTTSKYSEQPVDEEVMKSLAKQKLDIKEDIFLTPY
jgi:hypothetical protein